MLVTLRLYLPGGEERLLAQEIGHIPETPFEIVKRPSTELGDICNRQTTRLGGYLVQTEWSNAQKHLLDRSEVEVGVDPILLTS